MCKIIIKTEEKILETVESQNDLNEEGFMRFLEPFYSKKYPNYKIKIEIIEINDYWT